MPRKTKAMLKNIQKQNEEQSTPLCTLSLEAEEPSHLMGVPINQNSKTSSTSLLPTPELVDIPCIIPVVSHTPNIMVTQSWPSDVTPTAKVYNTTSSSTEDSLDLMVEATKAALHAANLPIKEVRRNVKIAGANSASFPSRVRNTSMPPSNTSNEEQQNLTEKTGMRQRQSVKRVLFPINPPMNDMRATSVSPKMPMGAAKKQRTTGTQVPKSNQNDEEYAKLDDEEVKCWQEHFETKQAIKLKLMQEISARSEGQRDLFNRYLHLDQSYLSVTGVERCDNCDRPIAECPNLYSDDCNQGYYPDDPMSGPEQQCTMLTVAWRDEDTSELRNFNTEDTSGTFPRYIDGRTPMIYSHDLWDIILTELYNLTNSI